MHYSDPAYEVALHLMGKDSQNDEDFENNEDAVDEFLYETYGIEDASKFQALLSDLAKYADKAKSELTGKVYSGFGVSKDGHGFWLFKVEQK
jgi:hypothetical protein